jgi:hypothetical protein
MKWIFRLFLCPLILFMYAARVCITSGLMMIIIFLEVCTWVWMSTSDKEYLLGYQISEGYRVMFSDCPMAYKAHNKFLWNHLFS